MFALATVQAQTIKTLPADPAVKSGVLPNGITYYIATNPAMKGVADFALVQKTGTGTVEGTDLISISQNNLTSIYRLSAPSVQEFFMNHGVVPGKNGFAKVTENASVYRFENVMLDKAGVVLDSALLVLIGMAEKSAQMDLPKVKGWFAPSDQALVVAGDVDSKSLIEKMKMLSYMIPAQKSFPREEYKWEEHDKLVVSRLDCPRSGLFTLIVQWKMQRTPLKYMNTVQPAIFEMFMTELGIIASDRVRTSLKSQGIPCADLSYDYLNGTRSFSDEIFRMSVTVSEEDMTKTIATVASVFSSLDASDAKGFEVKRAGFIYKDLLRNSLRQMESNQDYLDRCISAFVFNSPLTSRKDMVSFHNSRDLPEADEQNIFNAIISASLDGRHNLTLEYSTSDKNITDEYVEDVFESSWKGESTLTQQANMPDWTLPVGEPLKVKTSKKEPTSGGSIWTLSNGVKVVFKPMSSDGKVFYSLALNGGYASVKDLCSGEGAYMSDILRLSKIGGVTSDIFLDGLRRNGVTMSLKVTHSQFVLTGVAPYNKLDYLFKALISVMNEMEIDRSAVDYYRKCELLRKEFSKGGILDRIRYIDNAMCPGYRYSGVKDAEGLSPEFAEKAQQLISDLSKKINDGMLVLAGDIDEKVLKASLTTTAYGFKTDDRTFARPLVSYQPISGTVTYTAQGDAISMDMVLSTPISLTSDNYYAAEIASMVLRNELTRAVSKTGMSLDIRHNCRKEPQERFNLMVSLSEASVDGYAPGTAIKDPLVALNIVRNTLADPKSLDITKDELTAYKALVKKNIAERKKDPEYWLHVISMRYLDGKDFTTGCDARIDAVTVDNVKALLESLVKGSKVEYIISKK